MNGGNIVWCNAGSGGVCMMRNTWRDEQHPSFINFISSFLKANSFRLNCVPIAPVILFLCLSSMYLVVLSLIFLRFFICRISFSTVVVYQWPLFLWQTGTVTTTCQPLAGGLTFLIIWVSCFLCLKQWAL